MNTKIFEDLPQYAFERDKFCEALFTVCCEEEYVEFVSMYDFVTSSFIFKRVNDEFYIIHMPSGIMVNWYKHLGRTNTCNKDLTYDNLVEFFRMFIDEFREEIVQVRLKPAYEVSEEKGPDVNSMYPNSVLKIVLNSTYGTMKGE